MTVQEALVKVQREIEQALFELHHSVDPSKEQQVLYRQALWYVKAAQVRIWETR